VLLSERKVSVKIKSTDSIRIVVQDSRDFTEEKLFLKDTMEKVAQVEGRSV
jgi:hypothetical protein